MRKDIAETSGKVFAIKTKKKKQLGFRSAEGYLWILPACVMLLLFSYIPPIYAIIYSFTDWGIFEEVSFIGFENYVTLFTNDSAFWSSFGNVALFTISGLLLGNIAAIGLSEMLYNMKNEKLAAFFRYAFMLISIVPGVVSILVWEKIIFLPASSSLQGVANAILELFGLKGLEWYASTDTIKLSIILTGFPFMGGTSFLIYLAGLQGINVSVVEASRLDGLSSFKRIIYIDLPLMKGQIKYFLLTGVIGGLQNYNMQLILQNGNAASVPGYYIYKMGIEYSEMGYACAMGMVMFIVILALTLVNNFLLKNKEDA
ncbi:MAG: sugar ABC transporter permease [Christensenellaceae bacterium]|nr:sugar ABC transporter permease [Christensenellaceae bacterium]MDD6926567.1 sugar ABC transporter permease [bacterium]MDY2851131.1 sugar ABC transporter permease [Christensenellaceae bacterium]